MMLRSLEAHARARPDHQALQFGAQTLSYAELRDAVRQTIDLLRQAGVTRATPVGVYCDNHSAILLLYYALARLNGTLVPMNAALSSDEVRYIAQHAELVFLFTDAAHLPQAQAAVGTHGGCRVLDIASFFHACGSSHNNHGGHRSHGIGQDVTPINTNPDADTDTDTDADADADADAERNFLIIYTSGSTGVPKAVIHTQAAEQAGNQALIELWDVQPQDKLLVALPLGFAYGLSTGASMALQAGGAVILLPRFHPKDVLHAVTAHGITVFQGVPTMYAMLLEYAEQHALHPDFSAVRCLISAGAPLSADLRQRFAQRFHKPIDDYYALTEARPLFGRYAKDSAAVPVGAIGKAAPGVQVRIVADGRDVDAGQTGEIWARAPATTRGYFKAPDMTAAALVREGYFRTGDLGYCDPQGFYYLTGRIKDIIICGGANIAPAEVEDVLHRHPAVRMAAVIGAPDPTFGEIPVAFLVLTADSPCEDAELLAHCQALLAAFKIPRSLVRLAQMPLGMTGKIDKQTLLTHWQEMQARETQARDRQTHHPDSGVAA